MTLSLNNLTSSKYYITHSLYHSVDIINDSKMLTNYMYYPRVTRYTTEQRYNINAIVANVLLTWNFVSWKNNIASQNPTEQNWRMYKFLLCNLNNHLVMHYLLPISGTTNKNWFTNYGYTITSAFNVCHIPYQKGSPFWAGEILGEVTFGI